MAHRIVLAILLGLGLLAGCGGDDGGSAPSSESGFVSEAWFQERQLDYLRFATEVFQPGSVLNVVAHMERQRVEPDYRLPGPVPLDAWDASFAKMAALEDTRDFDALYFLQVLLDYRDEEMVPPALVDRVAEALIAFKFWYTEPTPPGMLDNSYYWTENHEVLFHAIEYLMGQMYPERVFTSDGRTGREHLADARQRLLRWFDLRARFGFFEWHSNVYYQKNLTPLLTLVEFADDDEIRTRAAMVLDLLLFDMALHTHRGAFGSTHGRSYKKDKMTSLDDDTWGGVKLLFDTTEVPYQSRSHPDATLLARSRHYRMPEALLRVARTDESFIDRERMGIALDELATYQPDPPAPYGFSFSDPEDLPVWWSMGAVTAWQVVPLTLQTLETYDLWMTDTFAPFAGFRPLGANPPLAQAIAIAAARYFNFALLREVNTYTHRNPDFMLSSALDYRKGSLAAQVHAWQATFDANALVFTNHPVTPPVESTVWGEDTEATGGYWTGEASMPRSAQHENVAIQIYAPQYSRTNPPPFAFFTYEPYTHAYVPQDHFDEVVQEGAWTFTRRHDGYLALYSHRPTEWIAYDPEVIATNGMVQPFDLRATGGPDNVWIAECGRAADWGNFVAFREAILAAAVEVSSRPGPGAGYDVLYDSPSRGRLTFGWESPLTVDGEEVAQEDFRRFDNPWARTEFDHPEVEIEIDGYGVRLDFEQGRREAW